MRRLITILLSVSSMAIVFAQGEAMFADVTCAGRFHIGVSGLTKVIAVYFPELRVVFAKSCVVVGRLGLDSARIANSLQIAAGFVFAKFHQSDGGACFRRPHSPIALA